MLENNTLDILKGAILLEHRGKALYDSVVKTTKADAVRELFKFLSNEEIQHISILENQYRKINRNQDIELQDLEITDFHSEHPVLTEKIVKEISGAGYEASVIAAALDFEKRAVAYYSEYALSVTDQAEKGLYEWLAKWETTHMSLLAELDREIREQVWHDNSFWPLD
jgi:rubrerythrin